MSGIVGSRLNIRGSGIIGGLGSDGQVLTSAGAGQEIVFESVSSAAVTALNNATQSELVSVGSTTTELDAEANLTFTGSALTCIGTITVGVDNTGHDVKYFGATSGSYWLWDEDADGVVQIGTLTVGVDDAGHDVKLFGAAAGAYALWDESANLLDLRGATAAGPGHLKLTTGELTVVDADVLGKIEFQAPLETGADAILVGAAIWAEADDTFAAGVNNTDLVFALGKSEAAAEKFRFTADTEIGIGGANYGTDGQVLTSGGAGAAVAWEDAGGGAVTALNNATQSELVTVGSTTTELDAEANLTFTGSALTCIGTITVGVDNTGHDVKFFGATSGSSLLWDESADDLILTNGDIRTADEYGLIFGDGGDGQYTTNLNMRFDDSTGYPLIEFSHGTTKTTNGYSFSMGTGRQDFYCTGVEGGSAIIKLRSDENDDNGDLWISGMPFTAAGGPTDEIGWLHNASGSLDLEMKLTQSGVLTTEGTMNASTNIDYAEYFEWKTALADGQAIQDTYGLTVILDNDKVRLAEAGEESNVLGVVRPNNTSAIVGGSQNFHWKDRYLTDVWGQTQYEQYTQCDWDENRMNDNGKTSIYHHKYMKDRIPAKRIKPEGGDLNKSEPNWHTLEHNFFRDNDGNFVDLIVPTTDEEKAAAGYRERDVYRRDKGVDGKRVGDPLMRKAVNPDYVSQQNYVPRDKRRKEWCVVGLLGQVPIRDTAIIPTHWKKMKNIESGVDLYYIK